jgi:predicted Rossmann fold flavoprotein
MDRRIAVIGAGASGMAAALGALEQEDCQVTLYERQNRAGKKLLATGNGRCNLSNLHAAVEHYHGADPEFVQPALSQFGPEQTMQWFRSLGLLSAAEESGRVYPVTNTAASVLDVLRLALEARGAVFCCGQEIKSAQKKGNKFVLTDGTGQKIEADRLIIACGGPAGARVGGTDSGSRLLSSFGHECTKLRPSLVQVRCDNTWTRALKGVRADAVVTLKQNGTAVEHMHGEVQFTDYGISGPAVFDLSRAASFSSNGAVVVLDLLPETAFAELETYLEDKRKAFPDMRAEYLFAGALHNTIGRTVVRRAGISIDAHLSSLSASQLRTAAGLVKHFELPLIGTLGFEDAQATAGGALTSQFDPLTMESRLVPGLYACGEVLDIDGDCGGYNLQWAWSSGRLAGLSAGKKD